MPAGPPLTRRTALALGAGVIVLTGCEDGDAPSQAAPASADPDVAADAEPDAEPDAELVGDVVDELTRVRVMASSAGAADLVALHDAHLEALDAATSTTSTSPAPPTTAPPATAPPGGARALWRHERALQTSLVEAATAARSGALAALLASMSAAQSQVLTQRRMSR